MAARSHVPPEATDPSDSPREGSSDPQTPAGGGTLQSCSDPRIQAYGTTLEAMALLDRLFDRSFRESCAISHSWFEAMLRIERSGGFMTMGELADQVILTSGGVTRLVDRLAEEGLAERRACETDRRVQYVAITPKGREKLSDALDVHLEDLDRHFSGLMDDRELRTISDVMERIRASGDHS